jgi:hypothetical protein
MVGLVSGAIGLLVGGVAGAIGRLVTGAIVGAALSALISVGTYWLMQAAGALFGSHTPSFILLVVAGALARWYRRGRRPDGGQTPRQPARSGLRPDHTALTRRRFVRLLGQSITA